MRWGQSEVWKLLESIHESVQPDNVPIGRMRKTFDLCWPALEGDVQKFELQVAKDVAWIVPKSDSKGAKNEKLQPIEEGILTAIARSVEACEEGWVSLASVCSQVALSPTRGRYHVEQIEKSGLVELDCYDACYLKAPGRAYVIEHDLIK